MAYHHTDYSKHTISTVQQRANMCSKQVDGIWGPITLGAVCDAALEGLPWTDLHQPTIKDIQSRVGAVVDGDLGEETVCQLRAWRDFHGTLAFSDFNKAWDASGPTNPSNEYPSNDIRWFQLNDPLGKAGNAFLIDVSYHQGKPDWDRVWRESGIAGTIIKSTEGRTYTDPEFRTNCDAHKRLGRPWGIYHYCHLAWNGRRTSVSGAMDNIMRALDGDEPPLGIWPDLEPKEVRELVELEGPVSAADWVQEFVELIETRTGKQPGLYAHWQIVRMLGVLAKRFQHLPMWWASYPTNPSPLDRWGGYPLYHRKMADYENWSHELWQFSDKGAVPGIRGNVDLNRFNGDRQVFDTFVQRMSG